MKLFRRRSDLVCRDAVSLIGNYLDGALSPKDTRRLEAHLASCPHCAEYVGQLRATIELAGRQPKPVLEPQTEQALSDLFQRWRSE
jgi:anti-sigma factor RsiW